MKKIETAFRIKGSLVADTDQQPVSLNFYQATLFEGRAINARGDLHIGCFFQFMPRPEPKGMIF